MTSQFSVRLKKTCEEKILNYQSCFASNRNYEYYYENITVKESKIHQRMTYTITYNIIKIVNENN